MGPFNKNSNKRIKSLFILLAAALSIIVCCLLFLLPHKKNAIATTPAKEFVLIVDPGHGGNDEGTKNKNIKEKDITLAIAKQVAALAPQYGIKVVLTRYNDTFINPVSRVNIALTQHADAYVSIHVNELRGYSYVSGMQVYVSGKNPDFAQSRMLASAIAQNLGVDFKISQILQQRAENIYVLAENTMPSVLIECGFITNPNDLKLLTDSTKTLVIAQQVLSGAQAYAQHAAINEYAVKAVQAVTPHHKSIITSAALHIRKTHHRGSKTA